jgi:Cu(I)/Ag(I) efflux system membrane fusion protein
MTISPRLLYWAALIAVAVAPSCRQTAPEEAAVHDRDGGAEAAEAAPLTLSPEAVAAADIRTAAAEMRVLKRRISAPGEIEPNARRLAHLTARTGGRVERVLAVAGDRVRAGQALAEIYSPDFMSLQAEFIQAAERARRQGGDPADAAAARALRESARERLLLVGATAAEADGLDTTPVPRPLLVVRAPFAATVSGAAVLPGDHVEMGASLFRLADLSTLWAGLRIQEKDLAAVSPGAAVELRSRAYPDEVFRGRILLIGDALDPATRTVIVRAEVPNGAGKLKTGMYVEAVFDGNEERRGLVVPESAVQDDAGTPIVFVRTEERTFTRRVVETGERFVGIVEILKGVSEGETVVTSGSFLLKSEMRKGALVGD